MAKCKLFKQVITARGRRFCPAVLSPNGRLKPDIVLVDGVEKHVLGTYYLYWRDASKRYRHAVGDSTKAHAARLRKEAELNAKAQGVPLAAPDAASPAMADAITEYLAEIKITKSAATHGAYSLSLRHFADSCHKAHIGEITRTDLIHYAHYLRETVETSDRTAHNHRSNVLTFLRSYGVDRLMLRKDKIKFVTLEPEVYEGEQLEKFFAVCDSEERVFFEFLLMTGFRKKEAAFTTWHDVDLKIGVVRVTAKIDQGFKPKDCEEREIPMPDRLIASLREWSRSRNGSEFVFPTRNGTPRRHRTQLLDLCKTIAKRAKLNPNDFWLHKFRATYATKLLQGGLDLRTVQQRLGHSDIESTMRYLKPSRSQQSRDKVNEIFK